MKIKRIVLDPDERLRAPNADVLNSWDELEPTVRKMFKVMYRTGIGIGLAAPQVGWNVRLFIMNTAEAKQPQTERVFWNPQIMETFGKPEPMSEGCLSLPGVDGHVPRFRKVRMRAVGPNGLVNEIFTGLAAQVVQHEIGHLAGKLCSDEFEDECPNS